MEWGIPDQPALQRLSVPAALRGRVVLVDFWTLTCTNWLRTEPYIRAWSRAYRDDCLVVIGVHTPGVLVLARSVSPMRSTFAAAAALLLLIMPASARASLRDCHIQATNTATISSARDMSCERAAREMRDYKGQISRRFTTPARFMCTRVSGGQFGGQWRCVHRNKAFRFEFRD